MVVIIRIRYRTFVWFYLFIFLWSENSSFYRQSDILCRWKYLHYETFYWPINILYLYFLYNIIKRVYTDFGHASVVCRWCFYTSRLSSFKVMCVFVHIYNIFKKNRMELVKASTVFDLSPLNVRFYLFFIIEWKYVLGIHYLNYMFSLWLNEKKKTLPIISLFNSSKWYNLYSSIIGIIIIVTVNRRIRILIRVVLLFPSRK